MMQPDERFIEVMATDSFNLDVIVLNESDQNLYDRPDEEIKT